MGWAEFISFTLLILTLLAMSLYFGRQQFAALRRVYSGSLAPEEADYERRKSYLRLVSCGMTLFLAMLLGWLLLTYDATYGRYVREVADLPVAESPTPEQRALARVWLLPWGAVLLLVLALLILAMLDMWATRRFAQRQFRKIADERRAVIQAEIDRRRSHRNGKG